MKFWCAVVVNQTKSSTIVLWEYKDEYAIRTYGINSLKRMRIYNTVQKSSATSATTVNFYELPTYKRMFHIVFFANETLALLQSFPYLNIIFCRRRSEWEEKMWPHSEMAVQKYLATSHKLVKILCFKAEKCLQYKFMT